MKNQFSKIYEATKEHPEANTVVKELNAGVYVTTFKKENRTGILLADLYTYKYKGSVCNNPDEIVCHNTCAPACAKFVKTIKIKLIDY